MVFDWDNQEGEPVKQLDAPDRRDSHVEEHPKQGGKGDLERCIFIV